jgi:hypothetical protein
MEASRNDSCVITIVGYHGNSVYRVVASITVWVICGRFPWEAPHVHSKYVAPHCTEESSVRWSHCL